jgi:hypothetical protein
MAKLFISNSSKDREWTQWICDELRAMGHEIRVHLEGIDYRRNIHHG